MEAMQISALVERLTDDQLVEEMQRPSGMAPLHVIMQEMQRRAALRGGKPRGYATGGPVEESRASSIWDIVQSAIPEASMTSGYRTPQRQAQLIAQGAPAARNSRHTSGRAVDWVMPGSMSRDQVESSLASRGLPYEDVIYHPENNSWHVEMPPDWEPGSPSTPPPPPAPGLTGTDGFPNPQNMINDTLGLGDVLSGRMGLPAELGGIRDQYAEVADLMPDTNAAYDQMIQRLTQAETDYARSARGRPFIDAGLAMMTANTPNFMSALGTGGMAGFSARDRIDEQKRGLMNAVIQAQMAKSQNEARMAMANLEAASGMLRADRGAMAQAYDTASGLVRAGGQMQAAAAEDRTRRDISAAEIQARREIAKFESDSRLDLVREQAKIQAESDAKPEQIYQRLLASALDRVGERIMVPDESGSPQMKIYTREDAIRDASDGVQAALAYRTLLQSGAQQNPGAPVRSTTTPPANRVPLSEIFGD